MPLTDAQREYLKGLRFAVVATIGADGRPHQTVMWYVLHGDELLLSTPRDSLKHKHLRRDPRISLCIEDNYTYVTVAGVVTLDEDAGRARADYQRLQKRYRPTLVRMFAGLMLRGVGTWLRGRLRPQAASAADSSRVRDLLSRERVTIRVHIDKVHGSGAA